MTHRRGAGDAERKGFSLAVERTARERLCSLLKSGLMENFNNLSSKIIGAAIEVHKAVGPGLLESAYEACLCHELNLQGMSFDRQRPLPIQYKGERLDCGYRLDIVVENRIILELKSYQEIEPIHKAQLLSYLKLASLTLGLLLNFNV